MGSQQQPGETLPWRHQHPQPVHPEARHCKPVVHHSSLTDSFQPPAIAANYREVKIEWTRQLVAQQKQKTDKIHKETVLQNAVFDAEREKEVSRIENEKLVQRKTN